MHFNTLSYEAMENQNFFRWRFRIAILNNVKNSFILFLGLSLCRVVKHKEIVILDSKVDQVSFQLIDHCLSFSHILIRLLAIGYLGSIIVGHSKEDDKDLLRDEIEIF